MAGKLCGANRQNGKGKCRAFAMANGRCRVHGGASTGPKNPNKPYGNKNAVSHGLYASGLLDGEHEIYDSMEIGKVDDEIRITRILLKRAIDGQSRWERQKAAGGGDGELELYETTLNGVASRDGQAVSGRVKRVRRKKDFTTEIIRYTKMIGDLEVKKAHLESASKGGDDMEALRESIMKTSSIFKKPMKIVEPSEEVEGSDAG